MPLISQTRTHLELSCWCGFPTAPLVKQDDPVGGRVKEAPVFRAGASPRPTVAWMGRWQRWKKLINLNWFRLKIIFVTSLESKLKSHKKKLNFESQKLFQLQYNKKERGNLRNNMKKHVFILLTNLNIHKDDWLSFLVSWLLIVDWVDIINLQKPCIISFDFRIIVPECGLLCLTSHVYWMGSGK